MCMPKLTVKTTDRPMLHGFQREATKRKACEMRISPRVFRTAAMKLIRRWTERHEREVFMFFTGRNGSVRRTPTRCGCVPSWNSAAALTKQYRDEREVRQSFGCPAEERKRRRRLTDRSENREEQWRRQLSTCCAVADAKGKDVELQMQKGGAVSRLLVLTRGATRMALDGNNKQGPLSLRQTKESNA